MEPADSCSNSPASPVAISRMEPADSCSNSPPSPVSSSTPLWIGSPSRTRDSASRPRRSLLSSDFSAPLRREDGKVAIADRPSPPDELSKSLPSPPVSAFLDQEEEDALEPTTPPHLCSSFSVVPPTAPRKSIKYRAGPLGKHRPRRLFLGEGVPASAESEGADSSQPAVIRIHGADSSQPAVIRIHGALTPQHQPFNSFVPSQAPNPSRRLHMRDLR